MLPTYWTNINSLYMDSELAMEEGKILMICGAYIVHHTCSFYVHRLGRVPVLIYSLVAGTCPAGLRYILA